MILYMCVLLNNIEVFRFSTEISTAHQLRSTSAALETWRNIEGFSLTNLQER